MRAAISSRLRLPEFGQANDERDCGAGADTLDGDEQGKPAGKLPILCDKRADQQHMWASRRFWRRAISLFVQALEVHFPARLGHGLENDDLLLDLLEIGQLGIETYRSGYPAAVGSSSRLAVKAAISAASSLSFLACLSRLLAKARTWRRLKAAAAATPARRADAKATAIRSRPRLRSRCGLNAMLGKKGIELLQPGCVVSDAQMRAGGMDVLC